MRVHSLTVQLARTQHPVRAVTTREHLNEREAVGVRACVRAFVCSYV